MRTAAFLGLLLLLANACDENRVYEKNEDFPKRYWLVSELPVFEFEITDVKRPYNLYLNVRNEIAYPEARLFVTYYLNDSTGNELKKELVSHFLFEKKTGKPFGNSGLGDIYDHQIPVLKDYQFENPGKYTFKVEQFMREDTLHGVLSVGLRVERAVHE